MKTIAFSITVLIMLSFLSGCKKDYFPQPKVDDTKEYSFSSDIQPYLTNTCAKSGCHVSGAQKPDLSAGSAYENLTSGGYVDTLNAEGSKIVGKMKTNMPPGGASPADVAMMIAWIKKGAKDN